MTHNTSYIYESHTHNYYLIRWRLTTNRFPRGHPTQGRLHPVRTMTRRQHHTKFQNWSWNTQLSSNFWNIWTNLQPLLNLGICGPRKTKQCADNWAENHWGNLNIFSNKKSYLVWVYLQFVMFLQNGKFVRFPLHEDEVVIEELAASKFEVN